MKIPSDLLQFLIKPSQLYSMFMECTSYSMDLSLPINLTKKEPIRFCLEHNPCSYRILCPCNWCNHTLYTYLFVVRMPIWLIGIPAGLIIYVLLCCTVHPSSKSLLIIIIIIIINMVVHKCRHKVLLYLHNYM